jgi:hypothetical protein
MVERRALVIDNGDIRELPVGDTLAGAAGGGGGTYLTPTFGLAFNETYINISSSAYAAKGTIFLANVTMQVADVQGWLDSSQSIQMVLAECGAAQPHAITKIVAKTNIIAIGTGGSGVHRFSFASPVTLEAGKTYAAMWVRTDGTATAAAGVSFPVNVPTDPQNRYTSKGAIRYASKDPQTGDNTFFAADSAVRMTFNVYNDASKELLNANKLVLDAKTADHVITDTDLSGAVFLDMDVASANTVTVNQGLTGKEPVTISQKGVGQTSIVAGTGVTIQSPDGMLKLRGQYSSVTLVPLGADTYRLMGDLAA